MRVLLTMVWLALCACGVPVTAVDGDSGGGGGAAGGSGGGSGSLAAGITVTPSRDLVTTEAGGSALFTVVLDSQPTANVTIALTSSRETEGTVSPARLVFTVNDWSAPQTVTVTGVDDSAADGAQPYFVVTAAAISTDTAYDNFDASDVSISNTDDDSAGITVAPTSGLVTTEAGGTATFTVVLDSQPLADVTIGVTSSRVTEGIVAPASLVFTAANWNTPQTVTVTGVADTVSDGNQPYLVITAPVMSSDTGYSGMNPSDVSVTNNNVSVPTGPGLWVATTGSDTTGTGTQALPFLTIRKASQVATAGTTVHVMPGTYNQIVQTTANGTASARIRYLSETKGGAKVVGTGTEYTWNNKGSYVDIVGFDVSGSGRLGIFNEGSFVLVEGNHVHDMLVSGGCSGGGGAGINHGNYSATDNDTIGNIVHDIGVPGACNQVQGIYHSMLRGRIQNNIVYRVSAYGIHLWHAPDNVTITNNTVFACGNSQLGGGIVVGAGDSPGGIVVNNTIVANNIVFNNARSSILQYCTSAWPNCIGTTNRTMNNLVFGGPAISLRVGSATNTVNADPQFVNYQANGTGNYRLQPGSPAIDAGTPIGAPANDIEGTARPRSGGYDIGAYEF